MAEDSNKPAGPDLTQGVDANLLADGGMLVGKVGDGEVLLVRRGDKIFAVGAHCTHYHGPLADGLVVDDTIRCPWHHACFDLATGEALRAPALAPLDCWGIERRGGKIFVGEKLRPEQADSKTRRTGAQPQRIVIIGGGAAGFAAAEMLRRLDYSGAITMLSDDSAAPVDRPNLSKDYLAGNAPEDWVPLRPDSFYSENGIDLRLNTKVTAIDTSAREVTSAGGGAVSYDRLLLATGAEPVRLSFPGSTLPHVHTLRTLADCRAIIADAGKAKHAVVLGASFIGLEVAGSLRARGIEVHVVAPEKRPMERIMGPDMGDLIRAIHEEHGVIFHLEETASEIGAREVKLKGGSTLAAELVVMGVGVRPRIELAEKAGLAIDRGVKVNSYLETSTPGIFAAGDIARWPDTHSGDSIRVEHWVVAERQGQIAARNMLGRREKFVQVPFFWSQHYDVPINYVGHAESWDQIAVEGNVRNKDCLLRFKRGAKTLAAASIYRDMDSLKAEVELEEVIAAR
jgi:NADPH-dependent 2,4-dienoyl-CoA reductase/sulfur reductase-like enzyme/nitrite reductase/ring-hydroxylating ferredoxin subunit